MLVRHWKEYARRHSALQLNKRVFAMFFMFNIPDKSSEQTPASNRFSLELRPGQGQNETRFA